MLIECNIDIKSNSSKSVTVLGGYSDAIAVSSGGNELETMFLSIILRDGDAKTLVHNYSAYQQIAVRHRKYPKNVFTRNEMDMQVYHGRDNYTHIVFSRKKTIKGSVLPVVAIYNTFEETNLRDNYEFDDATIKGIYEAIVNNTSLPVLPEWISFIAEEMVRRGAIRFSRLCADKDRIMEDYGFNSILQFTINDTDIRDIISDGLRNYQISIDNCNSISQRLIDVTGLDSYLESYGQVLANRIQNEFKPLFNPDTMSFDKRVNDFFDVACYYSKKFQPYKKQKEVIQAAASSLDRQNNVIISGETGAGKTIMGIGTVAAHARKRNYSVLTMVPSKTIPEWVETIQGVSPLAEVHVVSTLAEFMSATKNINNPLRLNPLWIIMSEETMKMNYEKRPAVLWDDKKKCYVCPNCGRPVASTQRRLLNGSEAKTPLAAATDDFLSFSNKNATCKLVFNEKTGDVETGCGASLWTVARKTKEKPEDELAKNGWVNENNWVKIDGLGWVFRKNINSYETSIRNALNDISGEAPKSHAGNLEKKLKQITVYKSRGAVGRYLRRYSIAHYIRKHLNHCFDYLIADEVHQLASDAERGKAFGTIIGACWKSICLTGTLSNGYAKGLFYLLFRTQTRKMMEFGYGYSDITKFNSDYGVVERKNIKTGKIVKGEFHIEKSKKERKELPGISQVLVADFLINNLVAVKKEDIKDDLCEYTETPVGVDMDCELKDGYNSIVSMIVEDLNGRQVERRAVKHALMTATMFLDQPYGLDTRRLDTGDVIELSDTVIRNKERKFLEIAKYHKGKGEKMLVYIEYTQRLNLGNRLVKLMADEGINAIVMPKMSASKRQKWLTNLAKEGDVDAVVMNPAEVDVGVNLLDYTTIIFYETGTELTKIRQASQRSNRINQEHPVSVYFMYYNDTVQEDALGAISQKLSASKSIEGDFSESALQSMAEDNDITMRLVKSIVNNEHIKVEADRFSLTADTPSVKEEKSKKEAREKVMAIASDNRLQFSNRPKIRFIQIPADNCVSLIA